MIRIDLNDPVPLEEQVAAAFRQALAQGQLAAGDELPSVRQLAGDLGIHWNTVARAYRRLADEGLLEVRRGRSVRVRDRRPASSRASRTGLRKEFSAAIATGVIGGLSREDISRLFEEALAEFGERTKR